MRKERLELIISSVSSLTLLAVAFGAFSKKSRAEIKVRDNFTCQMCGTKDRFKLEAAHNSHKHNQRYNLPSNGRTLCAKCHIVDHITRRDDPSLGLTKKENDGAINLIWMRLSDKEKEEVFLMFSPVLIHILKSYQVQMFSTV